MKLSEWAKQNNMSYITAWRRWKQGKLPKGIVAKQTSSGSILVDVIKSEKNNKDITEAIKTLYPEDMHSIIEEDFEIVELTKKLESKIEQKTRKNEIDAIREDVEDLKELVSNLIYTVEKDKVVQEEIDAVLDSTDNTKDSLAYKKNVEKRKELSSKLAAGKLGFVRRDLNNNRKKVKVIKPEENDEPRLEEKG